MLLFQRLVLKLQCSAVLGNGTSKHERIYIHDLFLKILLQGINCLQVKAHRHRLTHCWILSFHVIYIIHNIHKAMFWAQQLIFALGFAGMLMQLCTDVILMFFTCCIFFAFYSTVLLFYISYYVYVSVLCVSPQSSNSVSPPYPPEPDLTLSTTLNSDLSTISDLLAWASDSGYTKVTSYTEADLANRFVIQLAGGGTGQDSCVSLVSITV